MKLIRRTYLYTLRWILPVMIVGSLVCFFTIEYVAHEETDEFLTYEMERIKEYHRENGNLSEFHNLAEIIPGKRYLQPVFRDTLILEPGDNEMVPHRELRFSLIHKGKPVGIVVRHLLLGTDDIIEGTVFIVLVMMLLVALVIFVMLNSVAGTIWKPFYSTLGRLKDYKIQNEVPAFPVSRIEEFDTLNNTLTAILQKMHEDYRTKKEFTENVSHELQTHLAIIRLNTEKMVNELEENDPRMEELRTIYKAATDLTHIQKALIQLSKISGGEFTNVKKINLKDTVRSSLELYREAIDLREIDLQTNVSGCKLRMDPGLAEVLVNNLIKNAVKHNSDKGLLEVTLSADQLIVENSGLPYSGNPSELFGRFKKGPGGNTGIGLSIVQEICNRYGFGLEYRYTANNTHRITVFFEKKGKS